MFHLNRKRKLTNKNLALLEILSKMSAPMIRVIIFSIFFASFNEARVITEEDIDHYRYLSKIYTFVLFFAESFLEFIETRQRPVKLKFGSIEIRTA